MAAYVLLDQNNIVHNTVSWDGVTDFATPFVKHLLPASPPDYRNGDTYDPNTDTVTPRPDTPAEATSRNYQTVLAKGAAALASNATFLALASPTQAQAVAQVQSLTRQVNGLLRLAGQALQTVSDT